MAHRYFIPLASALILAIFFLGHAILQPATGNLRADFTEQGLFTLSDGTVSTLKDIEEPIKLTFVYTRRVGQEYPAVRAYAQRVRELLATYESVAGSNLQVLEIDPTPFSIDEDEALAAGITAIETNGADPLYFGLIGRNLVDDELVIPFLAPERETTLEYDLTRLIARLDDPEPDTIGVITDLQNMKGNGEDAGYFVLQEIAATYSLRPIDPNFTALPDDLDVLMLAHASNLTDYQYYLIDQFILRKGRALILIDPAATTVSQSGGAFNTSRARTRSDLGPLASAWGVSLAENVVADIENALKINVSDAGRTLEVDQPIFIGLPRARMSANDTITAPLSLTLNLGAAGALVSEPDNASGFEFSPLLITGETPSFIPSAEVLKGLNPQGVIGLYESRSSSLTIAARLSGRVPSAFPSGPPEPDTDDPVAQELARLAGANAGPHLASSQTSAQIIVLADTDMLDDAFYIDPRSTSPQADNASFIMNALDNLTGGDALSNLRSRSENARPMTRVVDMRDAAQDKFFDEQTRLEQRLSEAQYRLEELQSIGGAGGFFSGDIEADLTPEERAELADLRQSVVETRARLRQIERDFRGDIDRLEGRLRALNIWGGPFIVFLLGLFVWWRNEKAAA